MELEIVRTKAEVDKVIDTCIENLNNNSHRYSGMTYEDGIRAGIEWLIGETDDYPFDEE